MSRYDDDWAHGRMRADYEDEDNTPKTKDKDMTHTTEAQADPFAGLVATSTSSFTDQFNARQAAAPAGPPPTDKQLSYLRSLDPAAEGRLREAGALTKSGVSAEIDRLKSLPPAERPKAAASAEPPEGFHELDGKVFKVQRAVHGSGNLYAKRLMLELAAELDGDGGKAKLDWEYVGRGPAFRSLSEETLLTLERAKELGHLYGVCCRCGATLTDETSIEAGIGPVCATKGWG